MNKTVLINILLVLLCICAILINHFFPNYKAVGIGCVILMGVVGVIKEKITKK